MGCYRNHRFKMFLQRQQSKATKPTKETVQALPLFFNQSSIANASRQNHEEMFYISDERRQQTCRV